MKEDTALYQKVAQAAKEVFTAKNEKYGKSWAFMRPTTMTDQIKIKIDRVINLECS